MGWNIETSRKRIREASESLEDLKVTRAQSAPDLDSIPLTGAVEVDGVHLYAEFVNAPALLASDSTESERSHKRFLRFLNLYQRAVHFVLAEAQVMKVDFQNQRLHAVVLEPFTDRRKRCARAVAVAALLREVVERANDEHDELDDAHLTIGLEDGRALAVRNGTRGDREPLFLGPPANAAAKLLATPDSGIHLGPDAAGALGVAAGLVAAGTIAECRRQSDFDLDADEVMVRWRKELSSSPLADFVFHRPTLPLSGLDLANLSPANSCRTDLISVFADIDGFSKFVAARLLDEDAASAARVLHVARKELRDVLNDFDGRKIRYHGDCIQGVLASGTGTTIERAQSAEDATRCAGALLDAFGAIRDQLPEARSLGLAIGLEAGPVALTRLGVKGRMNRCAAGTAVSSSENLQRKSQAGVVRVGKVFLEWANEEIRSIYDRDGVAKDLTYNKVMDSLLLASQGKRNNYVPPNVILPRAHCD